MTLSKGKKQQPQKVVIYGSEGIGKTTFATRFPNPLFLDTEQGSNQLDVNRIEGIDHWTALLGLVDELIANRQGFATLVIDTVDWAERMAIRHLCERAHKAGIEDFGYGKGYTYLAEEFGKLLEKLSALVQSGMHVVLVAHSQIRKFEQPDQTGSYDRYELKLTKQTAPLLKEWCDMLLFASYETKVVEVDGKKKGLGGRERQLYSSHTAAFDAKNRHGFPEKMPFAFESIAGAFVAPAAAPAKPSRAAKKNEPVAFDGGSVTPATEQQVKNIETLWKQLGYGPEKMTKVFEWLGVDALGGVEDWKDLMQPQAATLVGELSKRAAKANGKGAAA